jgi:Holliday junction resolvase RusA-like endonuclease
MIMAVWKGKAISVNDWHVVRKGRIYPSKEYEGFINSIAWAIKAECRQSFGHINILVASSLGKSFDHHNLSKAICDALERADVVENDRNIGIVTLWPPERHKRGAIDEIRIFIMKQETSP